MESTESELADTKAKFELGFARIELSSLNFDCAFRIKHSIHKDKSACEKAVSVLLEVFKLDGCHRYDEENFMEAVVDKDDLDQSVVNAGLEPLTFKATTREALSTPLSIPALDIHGRVDCLDGLQRTNAAKAFLNQNDQWWIVRLFSRDCKNTLRPREPNL